MPDEHSNPYDYIEAVAELAADDADFANWHNHHQHTMDAVGALSESLDVIDQLAASHIASMSTVLGGGVRGLIYKARSLAYQDGFDAGLAAANEADDDKEEPHDPGCCFPLQPPRCRWLPVPPGATTAIGLRPARPRPT